MNMRTEKMDLPQKISGLIQDFELHGRLIILDLALLITALLLIFTHDRVLFFHIIFVLLTFGAFYWKFRAFALRAVFWVTLTTTVVSITILTGETEAHEMVEIPLLTTILIMVFFIAGQRTKAEMALRQTNEELEGRVQRRTAELTRVLAAERVQRELAETLGEVFLALTARTSREAVLDEILDQVQRVVPYSAANIVLRNGKNLRTARYQGYEAFDTGDVISNLTQSLANLPLDAEVVKSRQPIVVAETRQNPLWVTLPGTQWVNSSIIVPICLHLDVIGLLRLDSDIPGKFSTHDIDSLLPLANAAAVALENARLYDLAQEELAERRLVEKELRELAAKNQAILDMIPDSLFQLRPDGTILDYKISKGTLLQELIGEGRISHHLRDLLPSDLVELMIHHINETFKSQTTQIFEYQLPLPHNTRDFEIWLVASGPVEVFAIVRDITERKSHATALEAERARIARDLHDLLGQSLGYLRLKLDGFTSKEVKPDPNKFRKDLIRMRDVANEAYELVRSMVVAARSTTSTHLATILLTQAKSIGNRAHFELHFSTTGQPYLLSPIVQQQIFYIFNEALNNVAKHAKAQNVYIQMIWQENSLNITILDDGQGFETSSFPSDGHFGLRIMQERAEEINGLLSITSNINEGTRLTIHLPLVPVA